MWGRLLLLRNRYRYDNYTGLECFKWRKATQNADHFDVDTIAQGVVEAVAEVGLDMPLVVRLEGTNVELGKEILDQSGLNILSATDMKDGAQKILEATRS